MEKNKQTNTAPEQAEKSLMIRARSDCDAIVSMIEREFKSFSGDIIQFSPEKKRLAQHLFAHADAKLNDLEMDRAEKKPGNLPVVWKNVDMQKFALDAVHRIELGIDALIPNHLHVIPYFNGKSKKYTIDQRIGYVGKDYYRRRFAIHPPKDIIYRLVHKNDTFEPKYRSGSIPFDTYDFDTPTPFDRGPVIGGFGYIIFDDETKNKLIVVSEARFLKSMAKAGTDKFWKPWGDEMRFKTLITIVTNELRVDPEKVSTSYFEVEKEDAETTIENDIPETPMDDIDPGAMDERKNQAREKQDTKSVQTDPDQSRPEKTGQETPPGDKPPYAQ